MYLAGLQAEISNIIRHCAKAYLYIYIGGGGKLYIYERKKQFRWYIKILYQKKYLNSLFDGASKLQLKNKKNIYLLKYCFFWSPNVSVSWNEDFFYFS